MSGRGAWPWVVTGGVAAALHVGKLPPALPVLEQSLGLSLVQSGFLISLVQLAGMALGLLVGLAADGLGLKRMMVGGLLLLSLAGAAGGGARDAGALLAWRALEGLGFLLAAMPAPGLIRRLVAERDLGPALGWWGAYMPLGTALALVGGPLAMQAIGWSGWWWLLALVSLLAAWCIAWRVPGEGKASAAPSAADRRDAPAWPRRLAATLRARGPWLVALCFACYSAQWLAVIGFLPTVQVASGVGLVTAGAATALAAAANMVGNIVAGRMLRAGVAPSLLLAAGFTAMGLGALLAFTPDWSAVSRPWSWCLPLVFVLLFSGCGGLVPGTLFALAVRLAPGPFAVSTTVGWMQQWSALGQFAGPPLVAWAAAGALGWRASGWVTGAFALMGLWFSWRLHRAVA